MTNNECYMIRNKACLTGIINLFVNSFLENPFIFPEK